MSQLHIWSNIFKALNKRSKIYFHFGLESFYPKNIYDFDD